MCNACFNTKLLISINLFCLVKSTDSNLMAFSLKSNCLHIPVRIQHDHDVDLDVDADVGADVESASLWSASLAGVRNTGNEI